jgi:acetyl-CoA C-acetyltransferase|tara:strand:- start:248 stop:1435 length:1188 start_codon:yes stop_codon:yes gene_type:complete
MSNKSKDIVITAALRTPIGKYTGLLKDLSADKLGSVVIKEVLHESKLKPNDVDEVIMGQVLTSATGQNPARQAAINAGIPVSKPAYIVNQVCGSGLRAIVSGYQSIKLGDNKIVVAGGQENMSKAPHAIFYREDKKLSENKLIDTMVHDGLIDAFNDYHMGITAENIASKYKISRYEQDIFALDSQSKAQKAISENKFQDEIINFQVKRKGKDFLFDRDEYPRSSLDLKKMSSLKTVFKKDGTVTAGNSSGLNDGAAAVVLMTREEAEKRSAKPIVKIVSWATCGVDPSLMGLGPIPAVNMAIKKAKWNIEDIDLFEVNEAFAAQSIAVIKDLNIPKELVNVNGGAIALGHPLGASGARVLVTLIHEMKRQNKSKGCATLCIGGGMGIALCVEKN